MRTTNGSLHSNTSGANAALSSSLPGDQKIVEAFLYCVIVFLGLVGNSLVIHLVRTTRAMQTTTNYLLVNLAAADCLTLVWSTPLHIFSIAYTHPGGTLGSWLCKLFTANNMAGITLAVSVYTLTLLSVERYHALLKPLSYRRLSEENVIYAIGAAWVLATVTQIPVFHFTKFDDRKGRCSSPWTARDTAQTMKYFVIGIITINIFIPIVVVSVCYSVLVNGLYCRNTIMAGRSTHGKKSREADIRSKKKIIKLLIVVTLAFFLCFLPFAVVMVLFALGSFKNYSPSDMVQLLIVFEVTKFLLYTNSSLNPILYAFQSTNYRNGFKRILLCGTANSRVRPKGENTEGTFRQMQPPTSISSSKEIGGKKSWYGASNGNDKSITTL